MSSYQQPPADDEDDMAVNPRFYAVVLDVLGSGAGPRLDVR